MPSHGLQHWCCSCRACSTLETPAICTLHLLSNESTPSCVLHTHLCTSSFFLNSTARLRNEDAPRSNCLGARAPEFGTRRLVRLITDHPSASSHMHLPVLLELASTSIAKSAEPHWPKQASCARQVILVAPNNTRPSPDVKNISICMDRMVVKSRC